MASHPPPSLPLIPRPRQLLFPHLCLPVLVLYLKQTFYNIRLLEIEQYLEKKELFLRERAHLSQLDGENYEIKCRSNGMMIAMLQ